MIKTIEGGVDKVFVMINSTNYNNDGKYCVNVGCLDDMVKLGITNQAEIEELDNLGIDEVAKTDFVGCYVIRIA